MIRRIRKHIKVIACFMAFNLLVEVIAPNVAVALTGGPSQPEVQSFEPVGTSEMVDLFSGDFNYNIPLLDVDGYPINMAYHSGIGMDDEASWVGLGWNINPGVINRAMRGLPDDFNGEKVTKEFNMRPNRTFGLSTDPLTLELFGLRISDKLKKVFSGLNANFGVKYNNYKGVGYDFGISVGKSVGPFRGKLGANYTSDGGFGLDPSLSFSTTMRDEDGKAQGTLGMQASTRINSRSGMKALNYGGSFTPANDMQKTIGGEKVGKVYQNHMGITGGGSYSFGTKTYVPNITMPMRSIAVSLGITAGLDFFGTHPAFSFKGSYSEQSLREKVVSKKAYGYYYEQNKDNDDALLDFNRERDGSLNENSTHLPLSNHTYDIMSASGHGIGGSFRAKRSDVAALHDDRMSSNNTGGSLGLEFGIGNLAHNGGDLTVNHNSSKSGLWVDGNRLLPRYNFQRHAYASYEPAYFKSGGDQAPVDKEFHNALFNDDAIRPDVMIGGVIAQRWKKKVGSNSEVNVLPVNRKSNNYAQKRAKRNQVFSFFNASEASKYALERDIKSVPINGTYVDGELNLEKLDRQTGNRKDHHMSEVSILKEDGMTYVYGIPAYNNKTIEKTFNVQQPGTGSISGVCQTGEVDYFSSGANPDNSNKNNKGLDYFYSSTSTPSYAHSYLITGVLSPDYVDVYSDGITDDDLGSAVKFNYTRAHEQYRWRIPYNQNKANYNEGLKTDKKDDKGSYAYGEKEIWYTHSIEGKNHVALFKISQREDGLGVLGENGGKDETLRQYKLDKIELYAKQDLLRYGSGATPIKTVHFKYDYSLCPDVQNNTGVTSVTGNSAKGKLTLKEVYFTYGTSGKGRLNAYKFDYSTVNPAYHLKGHDVWGNYKPAPSNCCGNEGNLSNADFPYVEQNQTSADQNVQAWTLTEIQLPSGGKIKIDYESDDYAFVQDKQAMQMLKIKGFGYEENGNVIKDPNQVYNKDRHFDLVFFDLQDPLTGSNAQEQLKQRYLRGITDLQFNIFSDINYKSNYEYIKGYVEIDASRCGITDNGSTGWVAMKKVKIGDKHPGHKNKMVSPVARAVWNFAKLNTPSLVYPFQADDATDVKKQILSLAGIFTDAKRMIEGFNKSLESENFGRRFNSGKSWVRLLSPNKQKLGGGARVKKIRMNDNWAEMGAKNAGASDEEFGQEYDYTMKEKQSNGETWTISSGVASFEPGMGRDENPLVQPRTITIENKLVPNNDILQEDPVGESFYPGPSVGYRMVTSHSLSKAGVARTGVGKSVSEFYTAYDYPVIVTETKLKKAPQKDKPFWAFLYSKKEESMTASQGYVIELNDMHGKLKAKWGYSETSSEPISGTKYIYQDKDKKGVRCLDNEVLHLKKDGSIVSNKQGVDIEMVNDFRESKDKSFSGGVQVNSEGMVLFVAPIIIVPLIIPSFDVNKNNVHTAVTTKVINRSGILHETQVFQEGAMISSQNHLYDSETGSVLLTSIQNEFKDRTYSFTQPAHWAYEGMGQAYKNMGLVFDNVNVYADHIQLPNGLNTSDYLFPGDKVAVTLNGGGKRICYVFAGDDGILNLIYRNGTPLFGNFKNCRIQVLKSGRKNLQSSSIGSVITKTNPLVGSAGNHSLQFQDILNVEAIEYSDKWQTFVPYIAEQNCEVMTDLGKDYIHLMNLLAQQTNFFKHHYKVTSLYAHEFNKTIGGQVVSPVGLVQLQGGTYVGITKFLATDTDIYLDYGNGVYELYEPFNPLSIHFNTHQSTHNISDIFTSLPIAIQNYYNSSSLKIANDSIGCLYTNAFARSAGAASSQISFNSECCMFDIAWGDIDSIASFNKFISSQRIDDYSSTLFVEILSKSGVMDTIAYKFESTKFDNEYCYRLYDCPPECYNVFNEKYINPYTTGLEGNWHPLRAFKFLSDRTYNSNNRDTRNDGIYTQYVPFWSYNASLDLCDPSGTSNSKWVWTSQTTKYTPFGNELETKDPLGRYSSALFGYNNTTPIAVASNSKVSQIMYDGFEDYNFLYPRAMYLCAVDHFNFTPVLSPSVVLDASQRHTGRYSLKIDANEEAVISRQLTDVIQNTIVSDPNISRTLKPSDDVEIFRPEAGTYILSAWIKEERLASATQFDEGKVQVKFLNGSAPSAIIDFKASGPIVEGWQRIEGKLVIPTTAESLQLKLMAAADVNTWFDDIRLHPVDGNMNSYAYDQRTMKLLGQLDENNYATIYEYDAEGTLIRVKKETEKGIQTLKETRNHLFKK